MNYLYVLFLSLGSVVVLFFLTKLVGNRQINEMSLFDYIVGITIGSIAAEMATDVDGNLMYAVIAMAVYALLAFLLSIASNHSIRLRKFLSGRALVLMNEGEIFKESFKKARLDINEFLSECRIAGYFDLSQIESAYLEPNGKISILPKAEYAPATPKDLNKSVTKARCSKNLIIDGVVIENNLSIIGMDMKWLLSQIKVKGASGPKDVFLATYCDGNLEVYLVNNNQDNDPFL